MLEQFKGKLIISCQALPDEPLHSSFIMGRMALAAKQAGAVGIRAQSTDDIREIKKVTGLPVIGLIKRNFDDSEIYITPTHQEIAELLDTSCEIIALDATLRKRPGDEKLADLVDQIHAGGRLALADISNDAEGLNAEKIGFDCVSTTMSGYTPYTPSFEARTTASSPAWPASFPSPSLPKAASTRRKTSDGSTNAAPTVPSSARLLPVPS